MQNFLRLVIVQLRLKENSDRVLCAITVSVRIEPKVTHTEVAEERFNRFVFQCVIINSILPDA